ncbi:MAG: FG-GAP-like repeat-containing protein [bacterium]
MQKLKIVLHFLIFLILFLVDISIAQNNFPYQVAWTTAAGDTSFGFSGEEINTRINNKLGLRAGFDFDDDGNLEFLTSLQTSNEFPVDNNLYLFEADGDNNYTLRWQYKVTEVQHQRNALAVGDLDENGQPEIVWVLDQPEDQPNVLIFEYDPNSGSFPDAPTATWNSPRSDAGAFRAEVDLKIHDLDNDGRQEIIMISFDGVIIASLSSPNLALPQFVEEYTNFTEMVWTFSTAIADLDNSGTNELITFGGWGLGGFTILEALGPGFYTLTANLGFDEVPDGFGCYNAMTSADLDGNGFPEIYYADTDGNIRSFATNGPISQITQNNFSLLGSVGFEVLTMIQNEKSFYVGTSFRSQIFQIDFNGGDVKDSLNYQITEIYADTDTTAGRAITIFRIAGATDLDGDDKDDIVFAAANHDASKPTLYVIESGFATAVEQTAQTNLPEDFILMQNYPNPFNPTTNVKFVLPNKNTISLKIFNSRGREVRTLIAGEVYAAGEHTVQWDARDDSGNRVASGVYLYTLTYGNVTKSRLMTLVK